MTRTMEAQELSRTDSIKPAPKKGLAKILKDHGFNINKRNKPAAEQEREDLCKSKPKI